MEWFLTSPFGSVIMAFAASPYIFIVFALIVALSINFVFFPSWKRGRRMERIFYDRLENMPLPQDFIKECTKQKDDMIKLIETLLRAHTAEQKLTIAKYMADIQDFYSKLAQYEEFLLEMVEENKKMGDRAEEAYSKTDEDIQMLLHIRSQMIELIISVLDSMKKDGMLKNMKEEDFAPLEEIMIVLNSTDKHQSAVYLDIGRKKYGLPRNKQIRFNRLFQPYDGEDSGKNNE